ncbi:hypothetical protein ACLKA7_007778 [Drosophila subpalustris]
MLSKIVCDLCNRAFEGVDVFAEHYSKCTGPLNAFQVMMEVVRNKASSRKTPATNEMEQSTTLVKASTAISSEAEMDQTSTSVEGSSSLSSGELSELPTTSKALKRPGVIVNRPAKTAKYDDVHCREPINNLAIDEECIQEYNRCTACEDTICGDESQKFFNYFTGRRVLLCSV